MTGFDIPLFNLINRTFSNPFFDLLMPIFSRLGGGELYFILGILLLFTKKRETKMLGLLIIAGLTFSYYAVGFLKVAFARPRPFAALPNVILMGEMSKSPSFPSNHASTAFMTAVLLSSRFKKHALFYLLAALMAFSRMYIGVHYPSDVLGGAFIGLIIGWFLLQVDRQIK